MRFSGVSALAIWNNAARTLTGLGGALVVNAVQNGSLAAASTVTFATGASQCLFNNVGAIAAAGGTVVIQYTDTVNTWTVVTIAAAATGGQDSMLNTQGTFWQVHNNAPATAVAYWWGGYRLNI